MNNVENLKPFKRLCVTIGNLPTAYIESMSYYEALTYLVKYLSNEVIPSVNNNSEAIKELQKLYIELKSYVDNYFENLDVQEEIDNKLDEMADNGELAEIVEAFIKTDLKFIFPKFWSNVKSGDCNLIQYKDYNILIDCYGTNAWTNVKAMLDNYDVSHIDYLIISHYHADHVGNIENLLTYNYIDTTTKIYLPAAVSFWGSEPTYYKNWCTTNNLDYEEPEENDYFTIEDVLKFTFTNCNVTTLNNYYNDPDLPSNIKQNNCSMVTLIEYGKTKALYVGDCQKMALGRLRKINFIDSQIDLYKIGHHGIDETTDEEFLKNIAPIYAVQTSGINDAQVNEFGISADACILESIGTKVYPCHIQTDYIEITSNTDTMNCSKGKAGCVSSSYSKIEYYVDINTNSNAIQDGSSSHPFKEISQAIGNLGSLPVTDVTIHVKNGYYSNGIDYGTSDSASYPKNNTSVQRPHNLYIVGESEQYTILNGLRLINANVKVEHCTIDTDNHNEAIYMLNSKLNMSECTVTSYTSTQNNKNGSYIRKSLACFENCGFDYCNIALNIVEGSVVTTRYCNYGSNVIDPINNRGHLREWGTNENTDIIIPNAKDYSKLKNYGTYFSPIILYADDPEFALSSISLNADIRNMNCIKIDYLDEDGVLNSTGIIDLSHNNRHWISLSEQKYDNGHIKEYGTCVQFRDGDAMYYQTSFTRDTDTSDSTVTINTTRKLSVIRIYGYMEEYYNLE